MDRCSLWPVCFCVDENIIWFVYRDIILCKYDCIERKTFIECVIPIESVRNHNRFFSMNMLGNNLLLLVPTNEKKVYIYDVGRKQYKKIDIYMPREPMFIKSYEICGDVYLVPFTYSHIVRICKGNSRLDYYLDVKNAIGCYPHFNDCCIIENTTVMCVNALNNLLYIINLKEKTVTLKEIGHSNAVYDYITCIDDKIVLVDNRNQKNYIVSKKTLDIIDEWWIEGKEHIVCNSMGKENILFDAIFDDWTGIYDIQGKMLYEENKKHKKTIWHNPNYRGVIEKYKNKIYYFSNSYNKMQVWDGIEKQTEYNFVVDESDLKMISKTVYKQTNMLLWEDCFTDIVSFLEYLKGV